MGKVIEIFDVAIQLKKLDWNVLKTSSNKIFIIDIDEKFSKEINKEFTKEQLLSVDSFIHNTTHELGAHQVVNYYKIIERTIVNNGHLILFCTNTFVNYNKNDLT